MRYVEAFLLFGIFIPMLAVIIGIPLMTINLLWRRRFRAALLVVAANIVICVMFSLFYSGDKSLESIIALWLLATAMVGATFSIWLRGRKRQNCHG